MAKLILNRLSKNFGSGSKPAVDDVSLTVRDGGFLALLGPSGCGKTTVLRMIAGFEQPTDGSILLGERVLADGGSMVPPERRNMAMVFQSYALWPHMSVADNAGYPLKVRGISGEKYREKVRQALAAVRLESFADRRPAELSGGQRQRVALARCLVTEPDVVLLDEPLANLDYKLREELRTELPKLFAEAGTIFVYATTEPHEALLLGGNTATLSQGRITQFGRTIEVFRQPCDLITAKTFADPPLNTIVLGKKGGSFQLDGSVALPVPVELAGIADGIYTIGFQPHHLSLAAPTAGAVSVPAKVTVTEITGSESFVHLQFADARWVMLAPGIKTFEADETVNVFIDPRHLMVFDQSGAAMTAQHKRAA